MAKYTEPALESRIASPHRDYASNLKIAQLAEVKALNNPIPGLMVKVCDSENLKKSLLMISWSPPKASKVGNYATPIFLHDSTVNVNKKIETIFNVYLKTVKDFWDKQQLRLL